MSLKFLINQLSPVFINWLKTSKLKLKFPFVCGIACEILGTYLKNKKYKVYIVEGHHKNDFVGLHVWLEVVCEAEPSEPRSSEPRSSDAITYIVDPTYFQYYVWDDNDLVSNNEILIGRKEYLQGSYFDLTCYKIDNRKDPLYPGQLSHLDDLDQIYNERFVRFLKNIENSRRTMLTKVLAIWSENGK